MSLSSAISTKELSIGYVLRNGKKKVVHTHLDLNLNSGEVTCLLGLNGAGKSTLLRTLCGFQPPLTGNVNILGKPLKKYSQSSFALTIGVVLTDKTNAGGISVFDLVALGRHPYTGFFGQLKAEDKEIIQQSMEWAGIAHKAANFVGELSDGERQKAMIAKALAQQCPIIILDEPTAFLDVTSRIETMVLLRKLATEQNKTILLSTHDMELAIQMGDCLWLMEKNKPIVCGTPEDLILSSQFEAFIAKEGIVFDSSTGRLNAARSTVPIGVEGDFFTAYWVGNALIRNGFLPSPFKDNYINVFCKNRNHLEIHFPDKDMLTVQSIADLVENIRMIKK